MAIGLWQLILILFIIFIIFGAGKLPKVMHDIGASIKSLRKGLSDEDDDKKP